jgi:uncharacterized protein (TIGR03435 family)
MKLPAALVLFAIAAGAQSFDVASVKLTTNIRTGYGNEHIVVRPGSLAMSNVRLRAMIKWAYDVKDYQISGPSWLHLPGWLGADVARYEVQAKAPADTPVATLRLMLQKLLAERFKLVLHRETREVPAYALTVTKLKVHKSEDPEGESGLGPAGPSINLVNTTMEQLADLLSGPLHTPVVDHTAVEGRFDFPIRLEKGDPDDAFISALREQFGLKLEKTKTQLAMLIVDSAEKQPTEN